MTNQIKVGLLFWIKFIFKEQLKHESFCVQRHYFDYHDIEFALNGKQPKMGNMYFTPKLIRVIQLE